MCAFIPYLPIRTNLTTTTTNKPLHKSTIPLLTLHPPDRVTPPPPSQTPSKRPPPKSTTTPTTKPPQQQPPTPQSPLHPTWHVYRNPLNLCVICSGEGHTRCLYCFGEGKVVIGPSESRDSVECPQCNGKTVEVCMRCEGSGQRPKWRVVWGADGRREKVRNLRNEEVLEGKEDPSMRRWREEVRVREEMEEKEGDGRMEEEGKGMGEDNGKEELNGGV